jgi:tetratricopeptide (TPR) repeat protein
MGKHAWAVADFTKALGLGHDLVDILMSRAEAYEELDEIDKALEDLGAAITLVGNSKGKTKLTQAAYTRCAKLRSKSGDHSGAIADCTRLIELYPEESVGYVVRAMAWFQKGDFERAERDAEAAIRINPQVSHTRLARAIVRLARRDFNGAVADLDLVIKNEPESAYLYKLRGFAYCKLEQFEKAIADLSEAIRRDPNDKVIRRARLILVAKSEKSIEPAIDLKNVPKTAGRDPAELD